MESGILLFDQQATYIPQLNPSSTASKMFASWWQTPSMMPSPYHRGRIQRTAVSRSRISNFVRMTPLLVLLSGLRLLIHLSITRSLLSLVPWGPLAYSMAPQTQLPYTLPRVLSDKLLLESTRCHSLNFLQAAFWQLWQPHSHHHYRSR